MAKKKKTEKLLRDEKDLLIAIRDHEEEYDTLMEVNDWAAATNLAIAGYIQYDEDTGEAAMTQKGWTAARELDYAGNPCETDCGPHLNPDTKKLKSKLLR